MFVDTHCHLNFDWFNQDREIVLDRARQAGVNRILNPGIDLASSKEAVSLAEKYPEVYAAIGVHPNDAASWNSDTLEDLRILAQQHKVVAIGEIGLDYYRDRTPRDLQVTIFENQLTLAAEIGMPVVIHVRDQSPENRKALNDTIAILKAWQHGIMESQDSLLRRTGVLHSYSGDEYSAKIAIELGFMIGITGPVTFHNASNLQSLVKELPLDNLLIETDSPFLTPHPYRGKRNEPAVRLVAEKISQLHNQSLEKVAEITTSSSERLFLW